jgi:hypothetical protein
MQYLLLLLLLLTFFAKINLMRREIEGTLFKPSPNIRELGIDKFQTILFKLKGSHNEESPNS